MLKVARRVHIPEGRERYRVCIQFQIAGGRLVISGGFISHLKSVRFWHVCNQFKKPHSSSGRTNDFQSFNGSPILPCGAILMKVCPCCNSKHSKLGIFCTKRCANKSKPRKQRSVEIKQKISSTLKARVLDNGTWGCLKLSAKTEKKCPKCSIMHTKPGIFCSRSCAAQTVNKHKLPPSKELRERISATLKQRVRIPIKLQSRCCPICSSEFYVRHFSAKHTCSRICRDKLLSQKSKTNINCGGYRPGSGRSKHGWYRGVQFDSTYELAFYIDQNNARLKRNTRRFKFRDTYYIPDFECDNVFYEIKGYHTPIVDEKIEAMRNQGHEIILISADQMKPIIERVKKQFSVKDLSLLYEQSKDSSKTSDSDK